MVFVLIQSHSPRSAHTFTSTIGWICSSDWIISNFTVRSNLKCTTILMKSLLLINKRLTKEQPWKQMRLLKQDRIIHCRYAYLYKVPICQINSAFQPKFHCGIAFSFLQINIIIIIICQGFFILKLLFNDNISNLTICEERTTTLQRSLCFFSKCSRRLPQWLLPVLIGCLFH